MLTYQILLTHNLARLHNICVAKNTPSDTANYLITAMVKAAQTEHPETEIRIDVDESDTKRTTHVLQLGFQRSKKVGYRIKAPKPPKD